MKTPLLAIALSWLSLILCDNASAAPFANGSFELPGITPGNEQVLAGGSTDITGWMVNAQSGTGTVYSAAGDFSPTENIAISIWQYGFRTTLQAPLQEPKLTRFDQHPTSGPFQVWLYSALGNVPTLYRNSSASANNLGEGYFLGAGKTGCHPGSSGEFAIFKWTAPAAGTYAIHADWLGLGSSSTVDVHVLINGSSTYNGDPIYDGALTGPLTTASYDSSSPFTLSAGTTVEFATGRGSDNSYVGDTTGINATISQVGSSNGMVWEKNGNSHGVTAQDGTHLVSFGHGGAHGDAISQTFDTVPGTSYNVSYQIAQIGSSGNDQQAMKVEAFNGTTSLATAVSNTLPTTQNQWDPGTTYTFTATSASTKLAFTDTTPQAGGGASDWVLDHVSVAATPTITIADFPFTGGRQLDISGGTGPYTVTVTSGSLPTGLSISSTGLVTGTADNGAYSFTIHVVDSLVASADRAFSGTINNPVTMPFTNGSFELPGITSGTEQALAGGSTVITRWVVDAQPGGNPTGTVYSAAGDFSPTLNNNTRIWQYGYRNLSDLESSTTWNFMETPSAYGPVLGWVHGGAPVAIYNTSASPASIGGGLLLGGNKAACHPGGSGEFAIFKWTAPAAGTYAIHADWLGLGANSTVDLHVLINGSATFNGNLIYSGALSGQGTTTAYNSSSPFQLSAGATVEFAVGYGSDNSYSSDMIGINATITELGSSSGVVWEKNGNSNGVTAQDGSHLVSFGHGGAHGDAISQTFDTVPGTSYSVSYQIAQTGSSGNDQQAMKVEAFNSTTSLATAVSNLIPTTQNQWAAGTTYTFAATSVSTKLVFTDTTPPAGGGASDWALDHVGVGVSSPQDIQVTPTYGGGPEYALGHLLDLGSSAAGVNPYTSYSYLTIKNAGGSALSGLVANITGVNAGDFQFITTTSPQLPGTLAPDESVTGYVVFNPAAVGTKSAALHIASDDPDESDFYINLTGAGFDPATGEHVDGFNPNASDGAVLDIVQATNDKLIVVGNFTHIGIGGQPHNRIARLKADGTVDGEFQAGANNSVLAAAVQSDGKIIIGGYFTTVTGTNGTFNHDHLARLNADGTVDNAWSPSTDGLVLALAIEQSGDSVLVGGTFDNVNGDSTTPRLARIDLLVGTGGKDLQYHPCDNGQIDKLFPLPGGQVLVGGTFTSIGGASRAYFTQLNANGTADGSFVSPVLNGRVRAIALDIFTSKIFIGGQFTIAGSNADYVNIARLNPGGSLDTDFVSGADDDVRVIYFQIDGKVLIGGYFNEVWSDFGWLPHRGIARLKSNGLLDFGFPAYAGESDLGVFAIEQIGADSIVGGSFSTMSGLPRNNIARVAAAVPDIYVLSTGAIVHTDGSARDFGTKLVGTSTIPTIFTIQNVGVGTLSGFSGVVGMTIDGPNAAAFSLSGIGVTSLTSGASAPISIIFTPQGQGAHEAWLHIHSNDPDEEPFDIKLIGSGGVPITDWRQTYFGTTSNTGNAADDADPDHDGITNLMEFATGGSPNASDVTPEFVMPPNGGFLEYRYTRNKLAMAEIIFQVEWSDTFAPGDWHSDDVTEMIVSDDGSIQQVQAAIPVGSEEHRFVRLKITR